METEISRVEDTDLNKRVGRANFYGDCDSDCGVSTEKDKNNSSKLLPNNLIINSSSSSSEELLINYVNDLITSTPDKKKVDIVDDVVNYLESCKKPLLEIKTILELKKEDKAAILLFTYRFKLIYLNLYKKIHNINPKSISFYLSDLQQKGLLRDVDKTDEYPKQRRLIEHAIKTKSRAGNYQVNRINYKALTRIGKYLTLLFKDELVNIIRKERKEKIEDIRTLLYHSHKQLEYEEQQRARAEAKREEIKMKEQAKTDRNESILRDYAELFSGLRTHDFTSKPSEKAREALKKINQETGHKLSFSELDDLRKEFWKKKFRFANNDSKDRKKQRRRDDEAFKSRV